MFCFGLAALAGFFAAMAKKLSLRDTVVAAGVSGVGGLVVGSLCVYLWGPDKWYLTCAGCGIAGWLGGNVVLDRLSFVAWTIARGKIPTLGTFPDREIPNAQAPLPRSTPADLSDFAPADLPASGGPGGRV
jgi:hypothetical protein